MVNEVVVYLQILSEPIICGIGKAFTDMAIAFDEEEHPLAVTSTVYIPLALAVYVELVAPDKAFPFCFH